MMNLGLMPRTLALPAECCNILYIYCQLAKAEVRLKQVKAYIHEEKRLSKMSDMERALEAACYGGNMPKLVAPEWEI